MVQKIPLNKESPDEIDISIMTCLRKYPPATLREVAEVIQRSHVTTYHRVRWLEAEGFVHHSPGAPKRSGRSKILTAKGLLYLNSLEPKNAN